MFGIMEYVAVLYTLLLFGIVGFILYLFLRVVRAFEKIADTYEKKN